MYTYIYIYVFAIDSVSVVVLHPRTFLRSFPIIPLVGSRYMTLVTMAPRHEVHKESCDILTCMATGRETKHSSHDQPNT